MREPFHLERYYGRFEHSTEFMLSSSDCEPMSARALLALAGAETGNNTAELLDLRLCYTESKGSRRLRTALAACYPHCSADDLLVGNAPQELILLAMQTLVAAGDRVVVQTPCYQSLRDVAVELGAEVVQWRVGADGSLDWPALMKLLTPATRLLVTNFPHNPTGSQPTRADWQRLADLVTARKLRWFSDEMYRGLARSDADEMPPAASLVPSAISLWGLSKSLNLPGLRLGWLCCRDRAFLAAVEQQKDWTTICSNALSEVLAVHALAVAPQLFAANRARIAENGALMMAFAGRHRDRLQFAPPQAGPVALCRVLTGKASDLAERVRTIGSALLVPSPLFQLDDHWLRIGLGRANFAAALAAWQRAM
jgi:aspartate/methionine/tyrosine aminotransferase